MKIDFVVTLLFYIYMSDFESMPPDQGTTNEQLGLSAEICTSLGLRLLKLATAHGAGGELHGLGLEPAVTAQHNDDGTVTFSSILRHKVLGNDFLHIAQDVTYWGQEHGALFRLQAIGTCVTRRAYAANFIHFGQRLPYFVSIDPLLPLAIPLTAHQLETLKQAVSEGELSRPDGHIPLFPNGF
jgi:hypothetical protein